MTYPTNTNGMDRVPDGYCQFGRVVICTGDVLQHVENGGLATVTLYKTRTDCYNMMLFAELADPEMPDTGSQLITAAFLDDLVANDTYDSVHRQTTAPKPERMVAVCAD